MKVIPPTDKKLADGQEMTQFEATNDWLFVPQSADASLNWIGNKFKRILAIALLSWERNITVEKC